MRIDTLAAGLVALCVWAVAQAQADTPPAPTPAPEQAAPPTTGLSAAELAAEPPESAADWQKPPVAAAAAKGVVISLYAEGAYQDAQGATVVDILEQDYAYVALELHDAEGRPVQGAEPTVTVDGGSRVQWLAESAAGRRSDALGMLEFALVAGPMNLDRIRIAFGEARAELRLNIISLAAAGFADPASIEGALPWATLARADVRYREDGGLRTRFPPELAKLDGQVVTLAGFMLPLEPEPQQRHFLLTSSPPSCFFHVPGGPAGAVEVRADKGIAVDWELLVLRGRLETVRESEEGVVYRLREAKKTEAPGAD